MPVETLQDLLEEELKDLLSAENQLIKALPRVAKAVESEELREALLEHLEETKTHVERLNEAFELLEAKPRAKKCKAMEGLIEEGKEMMEEDMAPALMDQGLIGGCQRIEHYEIAAYGTVRTLAKRLGLDDVAELLQQTLDEESAADEKLTQIAEELEVPSEGEEENEEEEEEKAAPAARGGRQTGGRGKTGGSGRGR